MRTKSANTKVLLDAINRHASNGLVENEIVDALVDEFEIDKFDAISVLTEWNEHQL